jgi:hypothetical protein
MGMGGVLSFPRANRFDTVWWDDKTSIPEKTLQIHLIVPPVSTGATSEELFDEIVATFHNQ